MTQDLFDLKAGIAAKDAGQDKVQEHGEDFVEQMRTYAKTFADSYGTVTSDDLRKYAAQYCKAPHHPNAWGAIFRGKHWKSVGFTRSSFVGNHARTIRIWQYIP